MDKRKLKKITDVMMQLSGIIMFFLVLYYVIFVGKGYYHSDCTDSIIWAQASCDSGSLVNPDFKYAGIMPLGGNVIMLPWVLIFGYGLTAQILGMITFLLMFVGSIVFLCKSLDFNNKWISVTVATILVIISSSEKFREIFWEHIIYYSLGVMLLMLILGLAIRYIKREKLYNTTGKDKNDKKNILHYSILFLVVIICAVNGMQIITLSSLPAMAALIAVVFFELHTDFTAKENRTIYELIVIMILGTIFGIMLGKVIIGDVVAGYANAYSCFSDSSEWMDNLLSVIPSIFSLLGVEVNNSISLYSFEGICHLLRIVFALVLVIVPIIMATMYSKFKKIEYKIIIIAHHFVTILILMGWTFGKINAANWRLSPVVVTASLLCVMFVKWIYENVEFKRLLLIVEVPVICMAFIVMANIVTMEKQTPTNANLTAVAEYLENNNLNYGYATFWQANILTLMSDSEVKVRNITVDEGGYSIYYYQTNVNWYKNAMGYSRYFVILTSQEYTDYYMNSATIERANEEVDCSGYKILIYDHNLFNT